MKASAAISRLSELIAEYGDLDLYAEGDEPLYLLTDVRKVDLIIDYDGNVERFFVMLNLQSNK